jgi:hypothetical protein
MVPMHAAALIAFADELEKISAAHGRMHVSKGRVGRRPISVSTLLEKDKKGTLFKKADSQGNPQDVRGDSVDDPGAAKPPKCQVEVPTRGANIPEQEKTGYRLTDTTQPFTSGEDMRAGNSKPRQPGDGPTQANMDVGEPNGRIEQPATRLRPVAITTDPGAKRPKRGDTPTRTDDINKVDAYDQRNNATTVTGLAQHSSDIGASNIAAEHS